MSVNRTAGYPDLSSSGASQYTPQIYALELLEKFYISTCMTGISNTKYEGSISKQGDKVIIRTRPDVTIFDYSKGMSLRDHRQTPESSTVELLIDKAKAYALNIDDIDEIQNDINALSEWAMDGGQQLAISIDRSILNAIDADAHASNTGATAGAISASYNMGVTGTPVVITKANALDVIVDMCSVLSEQNCPDTDRWLVLPEWWFNLLNKGDLRRADVTGDQTNKVIRNGYKGQISNFDLYASNNYTGVTDGAMTCWNVVYGHKSSLTFASQLIKNRTFPDPDSFATIMDGLQVYGYEVVKPDALGVCYAVKG